jgi:hypothetical protein
MIFHAHELPVTIHSERQNADMNAASFSQEGSFANTVEKSKGSSRSILDKFLQEGWKRRSLRSFVVILLLLLLLHGYVFTTTSMRPSRNFGQGVFGVDIFGG